MRVAIIGGGVSGLVTGYRLHEMFRSIGAEPPAEWDPEDYESGQVWPFLIDNDGDYQPRFLFYSSAKE